MKHASAIEEGFSQTRALRHEARARQIERARRYARSWPDVTKAEISTATGVPYYVVERALRGWTR